MSARAISEALIKKHEQCVLHPYLDACAKWTIGWGNRFLANGDPVTSDTKPMMQADADELFDVIITGLLSQVESMITADDAGDNVIAALTSFAYNEGAFALRGSTLLKLLNAGHKQLAANQFDVWIYGNGRPLDGLRRRRAEEKALFLKEDVPDAAEGRVV